MKKHFPPEFLNRLDDIVCFDPLAKGHLIGVARLMAEELNERLAPKNTNLCMTDAALEYAVACSYEPAYGARPLRRWLEHHMCARPAGLEPKGAGKQGSGERGTGGTCTLLRVEPRDWADGAPGFTASISTHSPCPLTTLPLPCPHLSRAASRTCPK